MAIHTLTQRGTDEVLWGEDGAEQVLGPAAARLKVKDEPELTPYPLQIDLVLVEGRYVVVRLIVHADTWADVQGAMEDRVDEKIPWPQPSTTVPPINVAGLDRVRLPQIIRKGLMGQLKWVRYDASGNRVMGMGRSEELPAVYVLARAAGEHPTKAVADHFGYTSASAAQRVARARKAGRLPPTTRGAR